MSKEYFDNLIATNASGIDEFMDIFLTETMKSANGTFGFYVSIHDINGLKIKKIITKYSLSSSEMAAYEVLSAHTEFNPSDVVTIPHPVITNLDDDGSSERIVLNILSYKITNDLQARFYIICPEEKNPEFLTEIKKCSTAISSLFTIYNKLDMARDGEERKASYLSGFAREMRTPLNALAGFSQLVKETPLDNALASKYIRIINETSARMISYINYFNEISDIEGGRVMLNERAVDLGILIDELFSLYEKKATEKNLIFAKDIATGGKFRIVADDQKVQRILSVLLSNAFDNTFSGSVILTVTIHHNDLVFSVTDTGTGISEQTGKNLYKYSQYNDSLVRSSSGTGLGLIISKSYISLMKGKIWYETRQGKGTEFCFSIPFRAAPEGSSSRYPGQSGNTPIVSKRSRILVAEDDDMNFTLIRNFLAGLNIEIIRAVNGKEATEIAASQNIDLVLMDIKMPVMDGYTASRIVRSMKPSLKIIAQTAYSDRSVAIMNGCDDFITKPFGKQQLISLVLSYLTT